MTARINLQPAFILHSQHYGDSSLLLDVFTRDYGRVSLLAKGHRRKRGQNAQVFVEHLVSWVGRSELKTLTAMEAERTSHYLVGRQLYAALYVNELLTRLLPKLDAHPRLFESYRALLPELGQRQDFEPGLRHFEFGLLAELGYGLNLSDEALSGDPIQEQTIYRYVAEEGFFPVSGKDGSSGINFVGADIQAIAAEDYTSLDTRRAAKRLARLALAPLLGPRPLKSRELFSQIKAHSAQTP